MKHNFSGNDISRAITKATSHQVPDDRTIGICRLFLESLPEPESVWQNCTFDEVKTSDIKVRVEYDERAIEGVVFWHDGESFAIRVGPHNKQSDDPHKDYIYIYRADNPVLYRIPKPVVYPDPAVHRYIIDHDDNDMLYQSYAGMSSRMDDGMYYSPENHLGVGPNRFSNWSPVSLVAKEEGK